MPPHEPIVGIDLGTTNSLVAVTSPHAHHAPRILPTSANHPMLPSIVGYDDRGRVASIGEPARTAARAHPRSTIHSVKRLMGRSFADAQRSGDQAYLAYTIAEGPGGTARVALPVAGAPDTLISPQEVSAAILGELRKQASAALGTPVSRAVITVPAYFDDAQRQATRDAARLAGLDAVRIINEPTAAALAYGLGLSRAQRSEQIVAVYDLGGGTFDLSILRITPSSPGSAADAFQVLTTSGDTHLGGDDMDHALVNLLVATLSNTEPLSPEARESLRQIAQNAKVRLTEHEAVTLDLPGHGAFSLTRSNFESRIAPLVERTINACRAALRDAERELAGQPITAVVLVGGATRVPLVRRRVAEFFGLEPYTALNPDEVVALGAAIQAGVLSGGGSGGGAASSLLLDVIPLSLGIETVGGAMAKLITRNSTVPARAGEMFSTSVDNQTAITLNILQGEREMASDCRSLGVSHLRGIPPMPAGIPKLRVEFHVDASGILTVHAHEERSGKRLRVQVVPNHGLTQAEVERIEHESLTHAREDMTRHRIADLIANSRLDAHWIARQFERLGPKLEPAASAEIRARLDTLNALIHAASADWRSVNPDEFHAAKEALDRASVRLHEISITESLRGELGTPR